MFVLKIVWIPKCIAKTFTNTIQPEEKKYLAYKQTKINLFLELLNELVRPNKTLGSYA